MKNRNQGITTTALYILYIGLVLFLCLFHFKNIPEINKTFLGLPFDKYVHFLMFFPYPFLCWMIYNYTKRGHSFCNPGGKRIRRFLPILIGGFVFAVITETLQGLTTYRTADPFDLLADTCGILFSGFLLFKFEKQIIKIAHALFGIEPYGKK
ncbi:MAG: VanZ family protein [Bacteroidales bacterium]|jgi:glycopeptide antibiotics resistance protein|nr:VanZ family protein [Bacteroidales bacterium]